MIEHLRAHGLLLGSLGAALLLVFLASLTIGPAAGPAATIAGLLEGQAGVMGLILFEVRLPRTLLGLLVGVTLGLSGAALQGFLRNPLAEPGLIGVAPAAALGAAVVFYMGLAGGMALAVPLGGIVGAFAGVVLVQLLAGAGSGSLTLILAGVAVSSFAAALTSLVLNLAPSPFAALEIVFWMMGSLTDRSFVHVGLASPFMILGWALLISLGRGLDAMTLGEEAAASLGFDLGTMRRRLIVGTALAVGAATSVTGAVGFVGLVVPHLLRPLVAHKPGALLPASALGGGVLTLLADLAVRLITPGRELKLGVVTALIGAPFFLVLVLQARRRAL